MQEYSLSVMDPSRALSFTKRSLPMIARSVSYWAHPVYLTVSARATFARDTVSHSVQDPELL